MSAKTQKPFRFYKELGQLHTAGSYLNPVDAYAGMLDLLRSVPTVDKSDLTLAEDFFALIQEARLETAAAAKPLAQQLTL